MKTHRLNRGKVADGFWTRLVGLMGRRRWPAGFEFVRFPRCRYLHTCFTFLRPDIVFFKDDGTVVSMVRGAGPWKFWGDFSARHCLEAKPGFLQKHRLRAGDRLRFMK
ncbi:MAG TPA: DUF192 domain-containing protein [bacterium]|nr:DUF192 domain-containing protein [bacterium]